jgi:type I restriction enzyme R subunit
VYLPDHGYPVVPPDDPDMPDPGAEDDSHGPQPPEGTDDGEAADGKKRRKYVVANVPVYVVAERVQFYGKDGKLITESLREYTRKQVRATYTSLDGFLKKWTTADRKQAIVRELEDQGIFLEALADEVGKDYDAFDLVCHVAFDAPPLTRRERVINVRKRNYFAKHGDAARKVLEALLDKYADEGVANIEDMNVLKVDPLARLGTPIEIIRVFGGKNEYLEAVRDLERAIYGIRTISAS